MLLHLVQRVLLPIVLLFFVSLFGLPSQLLIPPYPPSFRTFYTAALISHSTENMARLPPLPIIDLFRPYSFVIILSIEEVSDPLLSPTRKLVYARFLL